MRSGENTALTRSATAVFMRRGFTSPLLENTGMVSEQDARFPTQIRPDAPSGRFHLRSPRRNGIVADAWRLRSRDLAPDLTSRADELWSLSSHQLMSSIWWDRFKYSIQSIASPDARFTKLKLSRMRTS